MKKTFVTYMGTDSFIPGLLALNESLKQHNKKHELLILVSELVSPEFIELFRKNDMPFKVIQAIANPNELHDDKRNYKYTYTKLRIFELFEYKKLVYLDADMLVCKNIELLFDHPHFSAVAAGSLLLQNFSWKDLNSGLLVLEPKRQLFKKIINGVDHLYSKDGSDQGFLHSFYNRWSHHENLHLDHRYNVPAGYLNEYCADHGFTFSYSKRVLKTNVAVVHFFGHLKPWNINPRQIKRKTDDKLEQAILLWWDSYQRAIDNLKM